MADNSYTLQPLMSHTRIKVCQQPAAGQSIPGIIVHFYSAVLCNSTAVTNRKTLTSPFPQICGFKAYLP